MDIFRGGDVCSFGFLILILISVGGMMIKSRPDLDQWGHRFAAVAFVAYIILGGIDTKAETASEWAGLAFRGLFAAAFVLGVTWIALPILAFLHDHLLLRPRERARRWRDEMRRKRQQEDSKWEAERKAALAQAEWEQNAPERERQRLLAEERAKRSAEEQQQRRNARSAADLTYRYYTSRLGRDWFPKDEFDDYLKTYMGDNQPAAEVEQRGRELEGILERKMMDVQPPKRERTVESVSNWYANQRETIENSPMEDRAKRANLALLYARFTELISELMEKMQP